MAILTYTDVCNVLATVTNKQDPNLDVGVQVLLDHYADFIRRKFVGDDDIDLLCRRLFYRHNVAMDRITQRVEARRKRVRILIEELVRESPARTFDLDESLDDKTRWHALFIRVAYLPWDNVIDHQRGTGTWTKSHRMLLFTFNIWRDHLDMNLMTGPGDWQERKRLLQMAGQGMLKHVDVNAASSEKNFTVPVYEETILTEDQWRESNNAEIDTIVRSWWDAFATKTFPDIDKQARTHTL